jgi:hypothetical protein
MQERRERAADLRRLAEMSREIPGGYGEICDMLDKLAKEAEPEPSIYVCGRCGSDDVEMLARLWIRVCFSTYELAQSGNEDNLDEIDTYCNACASNPEIDDANGVELVEVT